MRRTFVLLALFVGLVLVSFRDRPSTAVNDANVVAEFGAPAAGLSPTDLFRFEQGRREFKRRFTRAEGLGPHFNATSCASCHERPLEGGSGPRYRDFFLAAETQPDGSTTKVFDDCTEENAAEQSSSLCLPSIVVPHYGPKGTIANPVDAEVEHPRIPAAADVIARRNSPPLFGLGLFPLIPEADILSRVDPDDLDGDGVSGRANRVASEDGALGLFGFKCQTASIEGFTRGALFNQMGITSDSTELIFAQSDSESGAVGVLAAAIFASKTAHAQAAEPRSRNFDFDGLRDPEITRGALSNMVLFVEKLAAPPRGFIGDAELRGEDVFSRIGCDSCHVASFEIPAGLIHPYTDLLLHDMGPELADGIVMDLASGSEFRTQPLWGLCHHPPFLHDGRADTVEAAILAHGGEAAGARDRYEALSASEKAELHRFLESL